MKAVLPALLLLLATAPASAQVSVGTNPGAPYGLHAIGSDHDRIQQTITVPSTAVFLPHMTLRFWFAPSATPLWHYTQIMIDDDEHQFYNSALNNFRRGWTTLTVFNLNLTPGDIFRFALVGDYTDLYYNTCFGDDAVDCAEPDPSYTRRTIGDAYSGGEASDFEGKGGDVVFRAWFHDDDYVATVPEPMTMTLLGTGLLGIAGAARRRRKQNS